MPVFLCILFYSTCKVFAKAPFYSVSGIFPDVLCDLLSTATASLFGKMQQVLALIATLILHTKCVHIVYRHVKLGHNLRSGFERA